MTVTEAVILRIRDICEKNDITPNGLAISSGVPQSTLKSILGGESLNPGIVTIKMLCDGINMPLPEFFDAPIFWELEQELE